LESIGSSYYFTDILTGTSADKLFAEIERGELLTQLEKYLNSLVTQDYSNLP
jgi:hypothetical protein